ncbi:MAG: protein kinase [Cytophagaceae bacterium]|nr:protein kinase [Gemmatimonadaceae bacterium]
MTDFGIARAIQASARGYALTMVGAAIGTPAYMSPEQAGADQELDGRSDVYSLGCVLFEMLTGQPPFTGMTAARVIIRHNTDPVPRARTMRPEVPIAVDELVHRALAKHPSERFATAGDLVTELERRDIAPTTRWTGVFATSAAEVAPTSLPFIAVIPFDNMSADPENEYFSDGITEDIIAQLSKVRGFRVMSRTSTMRYKGQRPGVPEIGRELGVTHVLEGSVRRAGARLRIVAQLIDARTDEHLWAETFDREMTDVFAIQTEVAEKIAEVLHARLSPTDRSRLARKPTDDIEAYHLYLLGRHYYNKVTAADFQRAVDHYRRAIERDPGYARAYAAIGEAQLYLGLGYWGIRPRDIVPDGMAMAMKALELDPDSAEAHATLGLCCQCYRHDWAASGSELSRAVELNPSASMIRVYYAMHLCAVGRFDEALRQRDVACLLDPGAMAVRGNACWILHLAGRTEDAIADGRTLRELEPASPYAAFSHGLVCSQGTNQAETIEAFRDAVRLSGGVSLYVVMLAYGLAHGGQHDEARVHLAELAERGKTEFVWPMGLAMAYGALGEEMVALEHLERAYEERVGWMQLMAREPMLEPLRHTARFQALVRKVGPAEALLA